MWFIWKLFLAIFHGLFGEAHLRAEEAATKQKKAFDQFKAGIETFLPLPTNNIWLLVDTQMKELVEDIEGDVGKGTGASWYAITILKDHVNCEIKALLWLNEVFTRAGAAEDAAEEELEKLLSKAKARVLNNKAKPVEEYEELRSRVLDCFNSNIKGMPGKSDKIVESIVGKYRDILMEKLEAAFKDLKDVDDVVGLAFTVVKNIFFKAIVPAMTDKVVD